VVSEISTQHCSPPKNRQEKEAPGDGAENVETSVSSFAARLQALRKKTEGSAPLQLPTGAAATSLRFQRASETFNCCLQLRKTAEGGGLSRRSFTADLKEKQAGIVSKHRQRNSEDTDKNQMDEKALQDSKAKKTPATEATPKKSTPAAATPPEREYRFRILVKCEPEKGATRHQRKKRRNERQISLGARRSVKPSPPRQKKSQRSQRRAKEVKSPPVKG